MKIKIFLLPFLILSAIYFNGCSNKGGSSPEEVIRINAKYMTEENLAGVESTIDPDSPDFEESKRLANLLFKTYDLKYEIESIEIIEQNDTEALVKFVQLTTKLNGPEFKDNRFTGIHTVRKTDNGWKIFATKQLNVKFLN